MNRPEKIYLQNFTNAEDQTEVTWCMTQQFEDDVLYVREDIAAADLLLMTAQLEKNTAIMHEAQEKIADLKVQLQRALNQLADARMRK